ncbi:MAG: alpha/beta fold hydrolase [Terriglobales bacterium]
MKRWRRWVRRAAIGAVAVLVALTLIGALYQALATRADRRNFPPPGKLVDVGGHRLHIQCAGEGRPTVVLETGALAMSAFWGWVQPQAAVHTRVCSYDRAGLGWSEPGPEPRDALRIARELRILLRNAGETPPYVLVGHSFGGLLVRVYADQYPEDVVGLLLLDSSHPDQEARFEKVLGKPSSFEEGLFSSLPVLARLGVLRFILPFTDFASRIDELPPRQAAEVKAFFADSSHQSAAKAEMALWEETTAQARATRPLGDLPLVVISAGETKTPSLERRVRNELHGELAALSSRGSHRILEGTTHGSLVENRSHASQVAEAIRELVEDARSQRKKK